MLGKVYSYIDIAQDSISYADKRSYFPLRANKCFQKCRHDKKKSWQQIN